MTDTDSAIRAAALGLAAAALLAACGAEAAPDQGSAGASPDGALATMGDWTGCEVFDDLAPLQEYLGVTAVDGQMHSDGLGEGLDAEAASCSGLFDLAVFEDVQGSFEYRSAGDAAIRAGVVPWESEDEAAENFQDRVQTRLANPSGIDYTDQVEGELAGDWDESHYVAADTANRFYVDAIGRHGTWLVYVSVDFLHDPGVEAYESAPEFYPDGTAEQMAVYPFTTEEVVAWIAETYLPRVQTDILHRAESE